MNNLDRIKKLAGIEERKVNFDPDDMYDQGKVRRNALEALMDMFNTAKEYEGEVTDEQIEILGGLMQDMDNAGIEPEKYSALNELWKSVSAYGNVSGLSTVKKAYQQIKQMAPEDKEQVKEDSVDMEKHNMLSDMYDTLEKLNSIYDELDSLDRDEDSSGVGDLTDQLTTMRKHIEGLYAVLDRASKIAPMENTDEDR